MTANLKSQAIRHRIGANGTLVLRNVAGSVRLRGSATDEVVVIARDALGQTPALNVGRSDGALHVEPERQGRNLFGATIGIGVPDIDFEVELPHGARVEVQCVSADIRGSELHGDQAYKLVSGDLELTGAAGRVEAKSVSGDMACRGERPIEISAVTTSGDVEVDAGRLELLRVRSVSGDVAVAGMFAAGPEHRVETVSGDLRLEPAGGLAIEASGPIVGLRSTIAGKVSSQRGQRGLVVGDGAARLRFRSMSGEVRVDARVDARDAAAPVATPAAERDALEILRAVERGELDVDEAARLLSEDETDA